MQRNTVTTIDKMQIGDRFHRQADRAKNVFTVIEVKPLVNKYRTLKHGAIQDGKKFPIHITTVTPLVFLRHKDEK